MGHSLEPRLVTALVTTIGTPSLVAHTLTGLTVDKAILGQMVLVSFAVFAGFAVLGLIVCKAMKLPLHFLSAVADVPQYRQYGIAAHSVRVRPERLGFVHRLLPLISITLQFTIESALLQAAPIPGVVEDAVDLCGRAVAGLSRDRVAGSALALQPRWACWAVSPFP